MKKINARLLSALLALLLFTLTACSGAKDGMAPMDVNFNYQNEAGKIEEADEEPLPPTADAATIAENEWISAAEAPVSTFSADVDTASYTLFRKLVRTGYTVDELRRSFAAAFRTEEMVNYFRYDYPRPGEGELFGVRSVIAPCPWDAASRLLILGLATSDAEVPKVAGNNLVFLIDVSGSMNSSDKLGLLKKTFGYLTDQLDENDRVSIVTYSGKEEIVLEACAGNRKEEIRKAVDSLSASGSTNGQAGLEMAYRTALSCFIEGGNNRIIMASDGDLNVGISSPEELKQFISEKKNAGVYLSVLGFGSGNYRDGTMEAIADYGNGAYYYIDGESEAERIFSTELLSTLYTVAEDVKLQLTFNPETVDSYRLVGYENRMLAAEDFEDDSKDAGELGAGHQVTVCYQLTLREDAAPLDPTAELAKLAVRWKTPGYTEGKAVTGESKLQETAVLASALTEEPDADYIFAASVAQISLMIRGSAYIKNPAAPAEILGRLRSSGAVKGDFWREEFCGLLEKLS